MAACNSRLHLSILFSSLFAFTCLQAQTLVTCDKYDSSGKASGVHKEWDIKSSGSNIYLLYNQSAPLDKGTWYLYIDHDWDKNGKFTPYQSIKLTPRPGKNWYAVDQKFDRPGKFQAKVLCNGIEKASTSFTLFPTKDENAKPIEEEEEVDTYYYEDCEFVFCQSVDANIKPVGAATNFKLGTNGKVDVTIFLDNQGKAFKTAGMMVVIYKNDNKYNSYNIKLDKKWDYVKFVETFKEPGSYIFDIYSNEDVFVTTGSVTITR